jgi:hypothetical protein
VPPTAVRHGGRSLPLSPHDARCIVLQFFSDHIFLKKNKEKCKKTTLMAGCWASWERNVYGAWAHAGVCPRSMHLWHTPRAESFLFILQNYTTVLNFIRFDHQPSWRTATAMGHGGWRSNRRGLRRLAVRSTAAGPTGGTASRHDPRRLRPIRCVPRRQVQPPWAPRR